MNIRHVLKIIDEISGYLSVFRVLELYWGYDLSAWNYLQYFIGQNMLNQQAITSNVYRRYGKAIIFQLLVFLITKLNHMSESFPVYHDHTQKRTPDYIPRIKHTFCVLSCFCYYFKLYRAYHITSSFNKATSTSDLILLQHWAHLYENAHLNIKFSQCTFRWKIKEKPLCNMFMPNQYTRNLNSMVVSATILLKFRLYLPKLVN